MLKIMVQRYICGDLPIWLAWVVCWLVQNSQQLEVELDQQESAEEFLLWVRECHRRRQQLANEVRGAWRG